MNRTYFDGTFFVLNKNGNVMATSDIGLLNVKYSFSINTSKCKYKNDHGVIIPDRIKPKDDKGYFELITRSVFQAGFSFEVIERKWEGFREVFSNFDSKKISKWSEGDIIEALESTLIVRNPKKIKATVENAKTFQEIVKNNGSFGKYLDSMKYLTYEEKSEEISSSFKWMGKTGTYVFFYSINEDVPDWEDR